MREFVNNDAGTSGVLREASAEKWLSADPRAVRRANDPPPKPCRAEWQRQDANRLSDILSAVPTTIHALHHYDTNTDCRQRTKTPKKSVT